VVGTGLLALRDLASHLKYDGGSPVRVRRTIAVGFSQTGRLLRHYVYEGLNTDHRGRKALDGVFAYVAGAGRGSFNHRFAEPSRDRNLLQTFDYPVDLFPHTSRGQVDPVSGARDGLLDNRYAARNRPKLFQVNTGYEYWGGGASLIHTDVLATRDVAPHPDERLYLIASASHNVAELPDSLAVVGSGARGIIGDPLDAVFPTRALFEALHRWVAAGELPLDLSVTQVFVETDLSEDPGRLFGPGLQAGYQFASRGGFTIVASAGVGYAPGVRDGENAFGGLVGLGLGYTWRRALRTVASAR
jgi:hypothetical protein